jgi:mannosyltransferase
VPLHVAALSAWTRVAGASETALRLPSALAGVLAAALAGLVGLSLAGARAGAWAGVLVALSPIHVLASREAGPEAPLVLVLLGALALLPGVERSGSAARAAGLGLALGVLGAGGVPAFAAVATLPVAWLALRADRRGAAAVAAAAFVVAVLAAALLGLARSPLDPAEVPSWVPETTLAGLVRCTGASFTRAVGLEYHLAFPHARHVLPLTALLAGLAALGAARLPARPRALLVAGATLPFALGAALALATGRVTPLQATRLLAALPFLAVLTAAGLASLRGWRAWLAGAATGATLAAFLGLALARPGYETSPTRALARRVAACATGGPVVVVQRPLDLLALAAWGVPGPFVPRATGEAPPAGAALVVGPVSACATGGAACADLPACPAP